VCQVHPKDPATHHAGSHRRSAPHRALRCLHSAALPRQAQPTPLTSLIPAPARARAKRPIVFLSMLVTRFSFHHCLPSTELRHLPFASPAPTKSPKSGARKHHKPRQHLLPGEPPSEENFHFSPLPVNRAAERVATDLPPSDMHALIYRNCSYGKNKNTSLHYINRRIFRPHKLDIFNLMSINIMSIAVVSSDELSFFRTSIHHN
jgi:hypothetical protein